MAKRVWDSEAPGLRPQLINADYNVCEDNVYLYFITEPAAVKGTVRVKLLGGFVNLDLSKDGQLIGVEVHNASKVLPEGAFR